MRNRLPVWFRQEIPDAHTLAIRHLLSEFDVHTVCQEAKCPNLTHCFKNNQLTFMILGSTCTRNCTFCHIGTVLKPKQKCPPKGDTLRLSREPSLIAKLIKLLGIKFAVISSVTRDDLDLGGADQFVRTIEAIRLLCPQTKIEVLIPDFQGSDEAFRVVAEARPDVIAHNLETVARLYPEIRPQADYWLSLEVLSKIKALKPDLTTKSSLMLGLGEKEEEVIETLQDLVNTGCEILTLGQYLAPSENHYPVKEFISIEQFERYRKIGLSLGFRSVFSEPLVRSSYQAEEVYQCTI